MCVCVPLCDRCCLFGPGVTGGNQGKGRAERRAHPPTYGRSGERAGRQEHATASGMCSHQFSLGYKLEEWSGPRGDRASDRAYKSGPDQVLQVALVKCRRSAAVSSVTRSDAGMRWQGVREDSLCIVLGRCQRKSASAALLWTQITRASLPEASKLLAHRGTCLSPCCDLLSWHTPPTLHCLRCPSPHCTLRKLILCWNLFFKL